MDYNALKTSGATLIKKFGVQWMVSSGASTIGNVAAIRVKIEQSAKKTGLALAVTQDVQLLVENNGTVLLPGQKLTRTGTTLLITAVEPIQPADVILLYKVTAS
jgi:hypothetical protein